MQFTKEQAADVIDVSQWDAVKKHHKTKSVEFFYDGKISVAVTLNPAYRFFIISSDPHHRQYFVNPEKALAAIEMAVDCHCPHCFEEIAK